MAKTSGVRRKVARSPKRSPGKVQRVHLAGDRQIQIVRRPTHEIVQIMDGARGSAISVRLTPDGIELVIAGASLTLRADGSLNLEAEHLQLTGRSGVSVKSNGDAMIEVAGRLQTTARSQALVATLGEVRVTANDDVRLDGERILLNS